MYWSNLTPSDDDNKSMGTETEPVAWQRFGWLLISTALNNPRSGEENSTFLIPEHLFDTGGLNEKSLTENWRLTLPAFVLFGIIRKEVICGGKISFVPSAVAWDSNGLPGSSLNSLTVMVNGLFASCWELSLMEQAK